jgi:methylmalonyl-CoA mutase
MNSSTPVRIVTAASLFDGHDASINIMRRVLQSKGCEVIHLGHNRSAKDVVMAAICEDVHAIAVSSYQGGHMEYFLYMKELLNAAGAHNIKIFGGGGGVITPKEIAELEKNGITKIYSPEDGMRLGLEGILDDLISKCRTKEFQTDFTKIDFSKISKREIAESISYIENKGEIPFSYTSKKIPVLGITGTGGAGKSSLIDELLLRFTDYFPRLKIALISIDPTRKRTQGALLGDRIRMGSTESDNIFMRSLATRSSGTELSPHIDKVVNFLKACSFDLILVETSGIGQGNDTITRVADYCLYVMTPEFGAQTQLEKIEMLDVADFIVINKFERATALDAIRDVRKQYKRNKKLFDLNDQELPIFGTVAALFNDPGVNELFKEVTSKLGFQSTNLQELKSAKESNNRTPLIHPSKISYLQNIASSCRKYQKITEEKTELLKQYEALKITSKIVSEKSVMENLNRLETLVGAETFNEINQLTNKIAEYQTGILMNGQETKFTSLSHLKISKVAVPKFYSLAQSYHFLKNENLPGYFPYTAGIFSFKRKEEEPKRMFAGEGGPKRTNQRFHYLSKDDAAKRLSTAFDSVTLYGEDPDYRPDIFGKIGESGVSICTVEDMEELYAGFDLTNALTSVSMTINGPAAIILAMYFNVAIRQKLKNEDQTNRVKQIEVMRSLRGTVQADILKEDQAQNTCIFSLNFSLKIMGDVQEFLSKNEIKNYYSVSISGYHIAEAGANPITQLAFTLANGFTYIEYYLSRGLKIDEFAQNLSFFFSNGLDSEYTVIGRVARKIWAIALRDCYKSNDKSQRLKYHIQTSGRSLHAQEIDFNDIRTTLQAYLALSDNCNSLHTNAYDEAITTPTEESVRRAMAIQMIVNREFGLNQTENNLQGSFIVNELTDLVEEAVLQEFERISERGGVLGAMETMYQRSKIQEESHYYETKKDNGELPIIGVNTFLSKDKKLVSDNIELTRASKSEKEEQIMRLELFKKHNLQNSKNALESLRKVVINGENIFEELLNTVNYCSLGEITNLLYQLGGKYRRST